MSTTAQPASTLQRWTGWLTLADAMPAIVAPLVAVLASPAPAWSAVPAALRPFSLAGAGAALLILCVPRARRAALAAALLFYALQVFNYYSGSSAFDFRSGIALSWTFSMPRGVLLLNVAALAGLMLTAWTLYRSGQTRRD